MYIQERVSGKWNKWVNEIKMQRKRWNHYATKEICNSFMKVKEMSKWIDYAIKEMNSVCNGRNE